MDCLFCKIIRGELPSRTVYEDSQVKVIMNINPNSKGHLLIIPKKHYTDLTEISKEDLVHVNEVSVKMSKLVEDKLGADGVALVVNYGETQAIKHYHLHVLPHYPGEGQFKEKMDVTDKDIEDVYNQLMK
jgi:histidine triad (HIT) family protein